MMLGSTRFILLSIFLIWIKTMFWSAWIKADISLCSFVPIFETQTFYYLSCKFEGVFYVKKLHMTSHNKLFMILGNCLWRLLMKLMQPFNTPANIYLLKGNYRNTRKRCGIFSKLTIKTSDRSGFFIVNFEHVSLLFYCWLSTSKC